MPLQHDFPMTQIAIIPCLRYFFAFLKHCVQTSAAAIAIAAAAVLIFFTHKSAKVHYVAGGGRPHGVR